MEQLSVFFTSLLASLVVAVPVGYAFGAGMVASVNPCGFALLPAYLALHLGVTPDGSPRRVSLQGVSKALLLSVVVTLGFVLLFGSVGFVVASGGSFLIDVMPWAGLIIGVAMALLGVWLLVGRRTLYVGFAQRLSSGIKTSPGGGLGSFFLFGIAYGICSLSCTLPIFLIVVGSSLAAQGFFAGFFQFISYALGMGLVLMVLAVGTALFKGVTASYMKRAIPYVERLSAVFIVAAGGFIVYYWLTIGELGGRIRDFF